ncbi:hypothetical protein D3C86_1645100 [compost metagenome]
MLTTFRSTSSGWQIPADAISSMALFTVSCWKRATRMLFSSGTSPFTNLGSCVATPVGQVFAWHSKAWIQPKANIIPLAELQRSAPVANVLMMSKPVMTLPLQIILIWSLIPKPFRQSYTKASASLNGMPTWSEYSCGAAPVPPSPPSTVIKSK